MRAVISRPQSSSSITFGCARLRAARPSACRAAPSPSSRPRGRRRRRSIRAAIRTRCRAAQLECGAVPPRWCDCAGEVPRSARPRRGRERRGSPAARRRRWRRRNKPSAIFIPDVERLQLVGTARTPASRLVRRCEALRPGRPRRARRFRSAALHGRFDDGQTRTATRERFSTL